MFPLSWLLEDDTIDSVIGMSHRISSEICKQVSCWSRGPVFLLALQVLVYNKVICYYKNR